MHPLWSAGTLARRIGAIPGIVRLRTAANHLVRRVHLVRLLAPARQWTDNPDPAEAIRWIGPLSLRHRALQALFCHPNSGVEYRLCAMPGSRFVAQIGMSHVVWDKRPPAVDFRVEIRSVEGTWTRSVERRVDAGRRVTDRRWHTLRVEMPPELDRYGEDVVVSLSTTLAPGCAADHGWALFGEPRLERPRPAGEVRRSLAAFAARARRGG